MIMSETSSLVIVRLKMNWQTKDSRETVHFETICTTKLSEMAGKDKVQGRGILNSVNLCVHLDHHEGC